MKRKKMEKEVVHLLEWIIEYPGVWQIVCNPDEKKLRLNLLRWHMICWSKNLCFI